MKTKKERFCCALSLGGGCAHDLGAWHEEKSATCYSSGEKGYYRCSKCGKYFEKDGVAEIDGGNIYIDIDENAHEFTYHAEVPATCNEWGAIEYYECKNCGRYFSDADRREEIFYSDLNIKPLGNYTLTFVNGAELNCTTDGVIEHWHCSVCNNNFEYENGLFGIYNIVLSKHHNITTVSEQAATCTAEGNIKYYHCEACEKNFSDSDCTTEISNADIVVAATGHSLAHVDAEENTHDANGNIAHWHCNSCGKNFADEQATTQIDVTISKGHHWGDNGIYKECDQKEYNTGLEFTLQDDDTHKVSKGTFDGSQLILPSKYEGKNVTAIAKDGFKDCSAIETIKLPNTLTELEIPSTVTEIKGYVFLGCSSLTSIEIPSSVTSIGQFAFDSSNLTSVTFGENSQLASIGKAALWNCDGLTSIVIPDSVTSIGESAFHGCKGISSVVIPSNVTSMGITVFRSSSEITIYCEAESKPDGWNPG